MSKTPWRIFESPHAIGEHLAERLLKRIEEARSSNRSFLMGCPTGRTPRPVYAAMARRLAATPQDLSHLVLVMMDEYMVEGNDGFAYAPATAPWSCHRFAESEIANVLSGQRPQPLRLRDDAIWFPDPRDPAAYDARIADAGGIDFFLLASGASDGHVAFNPPGSARDSRTRIITLSQATRADNLQTFPEFGSLAAVPTHGISVGIGTIAAASEAAMMLWGTAKAKSLSRVLRAERYERDWPATVIHECAIGEILSDVDASPKPAL